MEICYTTDPKEKPQCIFEGTVDGYDEKRDLALISIDSVRTDDEVIPLADFLETSQDFSFHYIQKFEDSVEIQDTVRILGYPSAGGSTVTVTKGTISGFDDLYRIDHFKTDAKINPGNSGGPVLNDANELVGIARAVSGGAGNIGWAITIDEIKSFLKENNYQLQTPESENNLEAKEIEEAEIPHSIDSQEPLFLDIDTTHKNYEAVRWLHEHGVINGYPDGTFRPRKSVNRAELLKILIEANPDDFVAAEYDKNCFADVSVGEWYAPYVCYGQEKSWVKGYQDNTFRPAQTVSKSEAVKIVLEAYSFSIPQLITETDFQDVQSGDWFAPYVQAANEMSILEESSGFFSPNAGMQRDGISEVIFRALQIRLEDSN